MFEHRAPRAIQAAVLALVLLTTGTPAFAATSGEIQDELDELNGQKSSIQSEMGDIQSRIDSLEYEQANTLEKKQMLDEKILLAQEELDVLAEQIAIEDGYLTALQEDLDEARENEQDQRQRWQERVRAMEESSDVGYIQVLFESTSFSDLLTRLDLINEVAAYDEQLEEEYTAAREAVQELESRAETVREENEQRREEWKEKQSILETDVSTANQLMAGLEDNLEEYQQMMDQAAAWEAEVEALIAEKKKELLDAQLLEQRGSQAGVVNQAGFIWPSYTKQLSSYFGNRKHPISGIWTGHKGVDILANYGTSVWSAAAGTVINASIGWNGGFGNVVMVMHPSGYTTIYAHLSSIAVVTGQSVAQGQVVGYVGSTGNSTGSHLHFEVHDMYGTPVDPLAFSYP